MYVVGVTGGIGSGKSAVSDEFANKGITVVDADVAARVVVAIGQPALIAIADRFGNSILLPDGTLDRKKLRDIIFKDPAERGWLEKLLHPLIFREISTQLNNATSPYSLLVSPLLVETGQNRLTNRILVVDVSEELQLQRTIERDNNTEVQVKAIMSAQASREKRLSYADDVIENNGDLEDLRKHVDLLHHRYIKLTDAI